MIDEIIAKVKEEERKKILDDMHKRQVEKETIRYVCITNFDALCIRKWKYRIYIGKKIHISQYTFQRIYRGSENMGNKR